jgi:hypothetical protein
MDVSLDLGAITYLVQIRKHWTQLEWRTPSISDSDIEVP